MQLNRKKLDLALASNCYNLRDLKQAAGVSNSTITKILGGRMPLQPKTLGKIAKALNVRVEDLIEG
jgi:DNA-binding Xre family transcriptional regulator